MIKKAVFLMQTDFYDKTVRESDGAERYWQSFKKNDTVADDAECAFVEILDPFPNLTPGQEECTPGEFLNMKFYYNLKKGNISFMESGNVSQIFSRLQFVPQGDFQVIVNSIPIEGQYGDFVGVYLDY